MKLQHLFVTTFLVVTGFINAQNKEITLEEIWGGEFRQEYLQSLRSLNNGKEYAVKNFDRSSNTMNVDVYSYETGEKTRTLISSADIDGLDFFQDYTLSDNENKVILSTQVQSIYRHSTTGIFYVYDFETEKLTSISENRIQEPTFSPDATKVAYVFKNNIYIKNLSSGETIQVTTDGKKNEVINGVTDWVYEEEFAFVRAFDWNKTGSEIAFLRFDETEVPEFSMDMYGTYGQQLYPTQEVFKYPKAGEKNSEVTLHLYDVDAKKTSAVDLKKDYEYIPRIKWTNNPEVLSVQAMNRHQNNLDLIFVNAEKNTAEIILEETDDAYVEITDNLTFLNDNSFIWTSEKDGWNHIYHYSKTGKLLDQVTKGNWEVTQYYGFDATTGRIYFQSTENGSINRDVFSVRSNGKNKVQLTQKRGSNDADFSADFTYFINSYTSATMPYEFTLHKARNGKKIRDIKDNKALLEKLKPYQLSNKEFSTLEVNGNELNMWTIKPKDYEATKKYPLLMFQYSGPGSQSVSNTFYGSNDYWYQMLAQQGYMIVCVDGRGTGFKGADFKKVTQKELGKFEVEDQIEAAKKLGAREDVDAERIGIWGWSYGGFMASNCIFQGNDTFTMAIAVAPVTSWRFYDSIYTERYMTTPQENASGYDDNSPINHVDGLKGDFLLIHGSGDDNVHVQNTMQMVEALVQANKQFDWAIYPDKNHGIYGGNTRLHLYTKMTNFIKENL
ncbi:S9 family peptidase [Mesonia aestuariivivens]|uniref:S9 family peptidase n=1 Tax=Mesonia aestuariivivens TaxID=2796128 RepID=A0ABS6VXW4_9FLAO|nr:S9 family peptidase [Mesonia aestuariivivens]MBW2960436.1 S9 family peptidase [Mesonia aestuariivivens]